MLTEGIFAALLCVFLFLFLNPFLALFVMAVVSLYRRVSVWVFVITASISFTLFFFLRDYGVEWYANSTDDVPQYISMYLTNSSLQFIEVLKRFIEVPSGNEPLWQIPSWALLNWFGASESVFVFLHYLIIFLLLFFALGMLSTRYLIPLALVYFFLTPTTLDSMAHIWRQQLASSMMLAGIGLYLNRGSKSGKWLVYGSAFMHLSFLFYGAVFFVSEWIRKRGWFDNKKLFIAYIAAILFGVPLLLTLAVPIINTYGSSKIISYFEGYGVDVFRVYLIIGIYAFPLLLSYFILPNDAINKHFMILCFSVFSIVLAIPSANSIYDRMLMFVLPLWGLYFVRNLFYSFHTSWRLPVLVVVFISGIIRLHAPVAEGFGVAKFLVFGNAFDPFMGALRCVLLL